MAVWVTGWEVADCPVATAVLVPQMAGTSTGSSTERVVDDTTVIDTDTVPFEAGAVPTATPLTVLVTGGGLTNGQVGAKTIVNVSPTVKVPANWVPTQGGGVTGVTDRLGRVVAGRAHRGVVGVTAVGGHER